MPPAEERVDILSGIGELVRLGKTNATQALTKGTGGVTFPFTRLIGLEEAIQKLGAELQSQYLSASHRRIARAAIILSRSEFPAVIFESVSATGPSSPLTGKGAGSAFHDWM
jgi:hypothetical protein